MDGTTPTLDELHGAGTPPGLPSGNASKDPSAENQQVITLTLEELAKRKEEYANEKQSKLDSRILSLENQVKGYEGLKAELDSARTVITTLEQQRNAAELDSAKDNPDAYELVKRRQELAVKERDLVAREQRLTTESDSVKKTNLETTAIALATEFGVNKDFLLKYGGNTPEAMRACATELKVTITGKPGENPPADKSKNTDATPQPPSNPNVPRPASASTPGASAPLTGFDLCAKELEAAKGQK